MSTFSFFDKKYATAQLALLLGGRHFRPFRVIYKAKEACPICKGRKREIIGLKYLTKIECRRCFGSGYVFVSPQLMGGFVKAKEN